ncbi:hypothetical protein I6G82_02645 [Lysinibacillus macroides]|uniref:Phage protein n=1 Tax=Lysinibacillus macroides TaxID=33935 RepID=A0A0M9DH09_9BACI|nr:hypothetical protein [Lysinibacillus macroides]KOY81288.1 hypothetical protein ADM90_19325 [Lysinibacillus macroides]QPR68550.1 hypothetical protein I6G82_02645 [Lysinibacillus macroides]
MVSARRKAIQSLYRGICTVKTWGSVTDPVTKITTQKETTKFENEPCKLSYEKQTTASNTGGPATISQTIKLSLAPELDVPPGSKIIVTQDGVTNEFTRSGLPDVHMDHQHILLEAFQGYT